MAHMAYDEDLLENGFFRALSGRQRRLYARAQAQRLVVCVPRAASTDAARLRAEDFEAHVLVPTADPAVFLTVSGKVCSAVLCYSCPASAPSPPYRTSDPSQLRAFSLVHTVPSPTSPVAHDLDLRRPAHAVMAAPPPIIVCIAKFGSLLR